ncbi:MAG TPA: hypothetical protein VHC19_00380 [Pirellulales bacterium]|jgi:hypothetical protein|nr:hypothetical protein [Pirellulales bacterium]
MVTLNDKQNGEFGDDLQHVIEPLANYICATERPRSSLKLALAALIRQIDQTNQSATAQVALTLDRRIAARA